MIDGVCVQGAVVYGNFVVGLTLCYVIMFVKILFFYVSGAIITTKEQNYI